MSASDSIILFGLNESASYEARNLRSKGNEVIFIGKSTKPDQITVAKKNYNLTQKIDIKTFVTTLGLPADKSGKLVSVLEIATSNIKDELAQLAQVFADIEKKKDGPNRLIISGHSFGDAFWGDDNGLITIDLMRKFFSAFPQAALVIEDLHLAACYSGNEHALKKWQSIFTNISTIWAYSGSAPGSYSGAVVHMTRWDKATRGNKIELDRVVAERTRKGQNVAVWSKKFGYISQSTKGVMELLNRITNAESTYQRFFSGALEVTDTQSGPLRMYYNDLQDLVGHGLSTATQRTTYKPRLETTIRLLYFDKKIKQKFAQHYKSQLQSAYKTLSKPLPKYETLSRKKCVEAVSEFDRMAKAPSSPSTHAISQVKILLMEGLINLDGKYIPSNWI